MNCRHAAEIALGWYLIAPPLVAPHDINFSAPLSGWNKQATFDSADACEQARSKLWTCGAILNDAQPGDPKEACGQSMRTTSHAKSKEEASTIGSSASQDMLAECIAADDPSLKEK
jgi:hypothetical protein